MSTKMNLEMTNKLVDGLTSEQWKMVCDWMRDASVRPADDTTLGYFIEAVQNVCFSPHEWSIEALNAVSRDPFISKNLKWIRVPSPAEEAIMANWLTTCDEGLLNPGTKFLHIVNADLIGQFVTPFFGNGFSAATLDEAVRVLTSRGQLVYFGKAPAQVAPAPTTPEVKALKMPTNFRKNQGRVNHAHTNEPEPVNDNQAQQAMVALLRMAQAQNHSGFVRTENLKMKNLLNSGTSYPNALAVLRDDFADYTATLFLEHSLKGAAGSTDGARASSRDRYAGIIREGRKAGMKTADIAKLVQIEVEGDTQRSVR